MANAPYYMRGHHFTSPTKVDQYAALYADHQTPDTPVASLEEHQNFVELLEAATTAAGQANKAMHTGAGKRKRMSSSPGHDGETVVEGGGRASVSKRLRRRVTTDPRLEEPDGGRRGRSDSGSVPPANESLLSDARAAGVHSAAALFRRSSEKTSRKYTRPPMSKLFMSLQLSPEQFLQLQAQAKSYMLDPAHPDRQSCVGSRGKGDTDMVKLRLFNCVRLFLEGGAGLQFFGKDVEKPGEDDTMEAARALGEEKAPADAKLLWPCDGNKIISLVTPLLRRMVTNERQRQYAIETRKGSAKKEASVEAPAAGNTAQGMNDGVGTQLESAQPVDPQHPNPLASVQDQHYYTTSPARSVTPEAAMRKVYRESATTYHLNPTETFKLPIQPPAEAVIQRLNLFVHKVMPSSRANIKPEPALLRAVTRLDNSDETPLSNMSWEKICVEVELLIRKAIYLYPELEDIPQTEHKPPTPQKPLVPILKPAMSPGALRDFAAAATEAQDRAVIEHSVEALEETATSPTFDLPSTLEKRISFAEPVVTRSISLEAMQNEPAPIEDATQTSRHSPQGDIREGVRTPLQVLGEKPLPRYEMHTLGTLGIKTISNSEEWHEAKLDVGCGIWTDKVLNVVVKIL